MINIFQNVTSSSMKLYKIYYIYTYMRGMFAILMSPMRNKRMSVSCDKQCRYVVVLQCWMLDVVVMRVVCCITLHSS